MRVENFSSKCKRQVYLYFISTQIINRRGCHMATHQNDKPDFERACLKVAGNSNWTLKQIMICKEPH